jgi:hypothetical protein
MRGHLYRLHCHGQVAAGENPLLRKTQRGVRAVTGLTLSQPSSKPQELTALQRLSMTKAEIMSLEALLGQLEGREIDRVYVCVCERERERERERELQRNTHAATQMRLPPPTACLHTQRIGTGDPLNCAFIRRK